MNISEFRKKYCITRSAFAVAVGVSITTAQNWENGTSEPNEENLKKINEMIYNVKEGKRVGNNGY